MKKNSNANKMRHFLRKHFIPIFVIVFVSGVGLVIHDMFRLRVKIIELTALEDASIYIQAIESFRTLYTSKVVERVRPQGIDVRHDYMEHEGAIPLPATLSMELGEHIGKHSKGAITRLYSDYPFPWREGGGPKDQFERVALFKLRRNPDEPYYEFVDYKGAWSLRYAKADLMRPACVSCHNSHPQSPRRDWKTGDVRGVLEIILPMKKINLDSVKTIRERLLLFVMLGGIGMFLLYHIVNWIRAEEK